MKPVELARKTIEEYVRNGIIIEPPEKVEGIDIEQAGTFVSIKTLGGDLRGCIGTILPTKNSVATEIVYNAVAAATEDPRFNPIEENELDNLEISVDILHPPEAVQSEKELDAKKYGVIVSSKTGKKALLLPDLEGVDTPEMQISVCRRKGWMSETEPVSLQRFKVDRYYQ